MRRMLAPSQATGFSNLEGLIGADAVARVEAPAKLGGRDVRFLRKALGWSSGELRPSSKRATKPSHAENNMEPVGPTSEKLLRLIVVKFLSEKTPGLEIDEKRKWSLLELAPWPQAAGGLGPKRVERLLREHRIHRVSAQEVLAALRAPALQVAPGVVEAAT